MHKSESMVFDLEERKSMGAVHKVCHAPAGGAYTVTGQNGIGQNGTEICGR